MLILVTGLPGSGKSTVAQILSHRLGAVVFNSDVIRRELFPNARNYSSRETQAVIRETERRTEQALQEGNTVILDALFTKQHPRDEYRMRAERLGVPFKIVYVTTPEEATKERMELRIKNGDASEATYEYYLDRKPHFEQVQGEYRTICNTGGIKELEEQLNDFLKEID